MSGSSANFRPWTASAPDIKPWLDGAAVALAKAYGDFIADAAGGGRTRPARVPNRHCSLRLWPTNSRHSMSPMALSPSVLPRQT